MDRSERGRLHSRAGQRTPRPAQTSRGDLPICAILYVKESPADEEPGRERAAVSLSGDSYGMRGFGW
jgi:hypothetical protein